MAFVRQRSTNDCGVAAVAMLCNVTYEEVLDVIVINGYGTTTDNARAAGLSLGYKTRSTKKNRLKVVRKPKGYEGDLWSLIPGNSLVKIAKDEGEHGWHWVVWRKNRIYDPSWGVYKSERYGRIPKSYMEFIKDE